MRRVGRRSLAGAAPCPHDAVASAHAVVAVSPGRWVSAVHLPPVADRQGEDDEAAILNVADDPVVADPIAPQPELAAFQGLAEVSRVLATLDAIIQPVEKATAHGRVE